ncbi:hypothetical protein EV175_001292 [Coemansia sp. RSA 1933]|nr:hypothetical protein EV175_001292 [Coemansia sp. RSA 1933]
MADLLETVDRFGSTMIKTSGPDMPQRVLLRYLEFYARLARPDVVQNTFNDTRRLNRERTASLYSAQQLALLRFAMEKAAATTNHSYYLRKTALRGMDPNTLAGIIESRLIRRSVEDIARDAWNRYRKSWLSIKMVHYGLVLALAWLIGKWLLVEKVRFVTTSTTDEKIAIVALLTVLVPLAIHVMMRYTTIGILKAPPLIDSLSPNRSGKDRLGAWLYKRSGPKVPLENDLRAREILRVAFPAAPTEAAGVELHELLWASYPMQSPRISWQLRLALGWARLARRFSVIDPMLAGEHGLNQRLALMWARNMVQMVPPSGYHHHHSLATVDAVAAETRTFISFVRRNFERTPFALASDDIQAVSAFVASNAGSAATTEFLEMITGGFVGLRPGGRSGKVSTQLDYYINFASEPLSKVGHAQQISGFEGAKPSDMSKGIEGAMIVSFAAVLGQLSRNPTHPQASASVSAALNMILDTTGSMPMSAALYRSAFLAATEVLHDPVVSAQLAASFEKRFLDGDRYVVHIVRRAHAPKPVGWKLPSAVPAGKDVQLNPLTDCISPYVAYLAQATIDTAADPGSRSDHVADFVERWNRAEIIGTESCIQCLNIATRSIGTSKTDRRLAAEMVEQWVLLGFRFVDAALDNKSVSLASKESVVRALVLLLEQVLRFTIAAGNAKQCGMCVHNKWKDIAARHPAVQTYASAAFNSLLIRVLSDHPQSRDHVMRALDVLDLMHGLAQIPELQALDTLYAAASRTNVDISRQISYWTHSIKSKAKDIKMSEFVKSLF